MLHGFSAEACMDAVHVEAARMEDTRMPDGSCMDAAHPRMSTRMTIPIMSTRMRIPLPEKCNDAEAVKSMIAQVDEFIINTTNTGVAERRGARIVHKIFNVRSKRNLEGDSDGTYGG